jgi:protein arginine kinase activator
LGVLPGKPAVAPRFNDLFAQLFTQRQENACPECGHTLMELRKTGRVGCPSCYLAFQQELTGIVGQEALTGGHAGLLPKRLQPLRWTYLERERIRDRMHSAVAEEDYESAAELRDEIRRRDEIHWSNDS